MGCFGEQPQGQILQLDDRPGASAFALKKIGWERLVAAMTDCARDSSGGGVGCFRGSAPSSRREEFERDLDDELRLHLELRVADLMRAGQSKESAERQARLEMGSREKFKDEVRATAGIRFFDELSQDLRYALRVMLAESRSSPWLRSVLSLWESG